MSEKNDEGRMDFLSMLIAMRNGGVAIDMEKEFKKVFAAVKSTEKAGSVTLKFAIAPAVKGGDVDKVVIQDTITSVEPKLEKKPTLFFLDENNNLTRNDTRQMSMYDLHETVEEVREID